MQTWGRIEDERSADPRGEEDKTRDKHVVREDDVHDDVDRDIPRWQTKNIVLLMTTEGCAISRKSKVSKPYRYLRV